MTQSLIYLFGIIRSCDHVDGFLDPVKLGAAEFGSLRYLSEGGICALISTLQFSQGSSFSQLLEEPAQAEALVLHHHRVLEAAAASTAVLPLRFGSVFTSEGPLRSILTEQQGRFLKTIRDFETSSEWGVKIYCERDLVNEDVRQHSIEIKNFQNTLRNASDGKKFFLQRKLEKMTSEAGENAIANFLRDTIICLKRVSKAHRPSKIQSNTLTSSGSELILNDAFLVERSREEEFHAAIAGLKKAYAAKGVTFKTTGPWPAYSFVPGKLTGDEHAV
ncbi:GvpL/GvpF family gas vesicle protein [Flexibacterium corallicola]|uniref:GvpL/GvpF family gas vesicle protein n=1 Tax=Flexibacterium corallicola TaxID=3037259 RepID=UPI00286F2038|nr:GvpL/GvpF family gas vesicle protein [Pseudovibrio sp. M1P-2-3]